MKKKKISQKNIIYFSRANDKNIKKIIFLSYFYNIEQKSKHRYLFNSDKYINNLKNYKQFFKMRCLISLSKGVPFKDYHLSRYYLVKFSDNLLVHSLIKI